MELDRAGLRILRFLAGGDARTMPAASPQLVLLEGADRGALAIEAAALASLEARALVARSGEALRLAAAGRAALRHLAARRTEPLLAPHCEPAAATVEAASGTASGISAGTSAGTASGTRAAYERVTVNLAESPLALLHRRKGKDGRPFVDGREFRAGERLRADYTRGQIMPRLGVNWGSVGSAGRGSGDAGGIGDLTDAALAARRQVEKALAAVGPELSGVLVDICCFLKGMEQVEVERGWPARSAKVVLKSALGALARHYEPAPARAAGPPALLHWGAGDYRPSLPRS